jgi:hypothetical protein
MESFGRPYADPTWAGLGFNSKRVVDDVRGSDDARELGRDLTQTADDYRGHVVYVKLPDGSQVFGYDVEAETLTDGSVVYNLILRAE